LSHVISTWLFLCLKCHVYQVWRRRHQMSFLLT
jgi:hypothetical protein